MTDHRTLISELSHAGVSAGHIAALEDLLAERDRATAALDDVRSLIDTGDASARMGYDTDMTSTISAIESRLDTYDQAARASRHLLDEEVPPNGRFPLPIERSNAALIADVQEHRVQPVEVIPRLVTALGETQRDLIGRLNRAEQERMTQVQALGRQLEAARGTINNRSFDAGARAAHGKKAFDAGSYGDVIAAGRAGHAREEAPTHG